MLPDHHESRRVARPTRGPTFPAVLDRDRVREWTRALQDEYRPLGPTELAIVRDMARHAAAMEKWGAAAESIERQAALHLPPLGRSPEAETPSTDLILAAAMANDAAERSERLHLDHSRAFYRGRATLEAVQQRRARSAALPPPNFADEQACLDHLFERFRCGRCRCARCGSTHGYVIAQRCWECGTCGTQAGVRSGTVMSGSQIPLWKWFEAVRWLLWRPALSTVELAEKLRIARLATVRKIARKIRDAMAAENASELLAGLDVHFAKTQLPEPSALGTRIPDGRQAVSTWKETHGSRALTSNNDYSESSSCPYRT